MAKKEIPLPVILLPDQIVVNIAKTSKHGFISIKGKLNSSGCEASYYSRGRQKYGLKVYKDLSVAIASYNRQKLAATHGLGPEVGRILIVKEKGKPIRFGYETEKAKSIDSNIKLFNKKAKYTRSKLKKLGIGGDFGDRNCGIIGDRIVAVDFGSHSEAKW